MAATRPSGQSTTPTDRRELKRVMGPGLLLLLVVGDILGTGIYALTGEVAAEVGGAAWLPLGLAFLVALVTAFSYLELVTKYPRAAGAALYTHKAFRNHFLTFLVAFAVMCSGITSASAAARAFAVNLVEALGLSVGNVVVLPLALAFIALVMAVNLRGVGESVKANVLLTAVELSGLLLVVVFSLYHIAGGDADFSRAVAFETGGDKGVFLALSTATSLAFFAMVGFEDSVNMAEETKNPTRDFPRVMLTGLGITGLIYVLVSLCAVAVVPVGRLAESETPLVTVVRTAVPGFPVGEAMPIISMFAVANSALINMLMASRLLYGMSRQGVLPPVLARVHPTRRTPWTAILCTTAVALAVVTLVSLRPEAEVVALLGGTTSLLLLAVFVVVNVAVLVLRRDRARWDHFRAGRLLPSLGAAMCLYLVLPWSSGRPGEQYQLAGALLALGVVLWAVTWVVWGRRRESDTPEGDASVA